MSRIIIELNEAKIGTNITILENGLIIANFTTLPLNQDIKRNSSNRIIDAIIAESLNIIKDAHDNEYEG